MIVRAGRLAVPQGSTTAPISVLDRNEMDLRQARGLDDLLSELPGITISGGPRRDGIMPVIRGLSDGRVVVRLDGARQNFQRNHRSQVFLDPSLLQQVEVLRGPASTLFGSGAIGGVVDFRTIEADTFLGPDTDFGGQVTGGYQSNGDERNGALTLAGRRADFGLIGSVSRARSDDFQDGNGDTEPFSGSNSLSGIIKASWRLAEDGLLTLSYLDFEDSSNTHSTADRPFDFNRLPLRSVDRETRQKTGSLRYTWQPEGNPLWDLDATLYRTDLSQRDQPLDESLAATRSELKTTGVDVFNTSRVEWLGFGHTLTYGIEAYRDDQAGFSGGLPDRGFSDSEQDTFGIFLQDRLVLGGRTDLVIGLRFDRITQKETSEAGRQRSRFNEFSPQVTLSHELIDGLAVYGSYAEAFRVPNLRERFIGGIHFGNNQFLPNPDLVPEKASNKEIGLTYLVRGVLNDADRLRGQLSFYQNDIDDYIEQIVRRADVEDPALVDTTRFENVGKARLRGIELDLRYDDPRFYLAATANLVRGDERRVRRPLEGIPADNVSLRGALLFPARDMEAGARLTAFARQDRLPPTTDPDAAGPTAGYLVTDLFLAAELLEGLRLNLRLDNVFDRGYRQAPNLIAGRGRSLKAQLSYRF
ncbi:MAG: TonB-dependent hemoglobin/transferrin/lactoferrin family receptor [Chromatiales bacterium]|nr:TonB-dependent hemoglobin/transferrin/lactoferrin family receptor [Chromatiales bacterium]